MIATDPIVLFHETVICDGSQHEVTLTTDGTTAYVLAGDHEQTTLYRADARISCPCPVDGCHGYADWDLATDSWTDATPDLIVLLGYGERIER